MAGPGGGPPRKSHTKSRKGCKTCKRRHIRCDELLPQCRNCTKHNCRCDYMDMPAAVEESSRGLRPPELLMTPEIEQQIDDWRMTGAPPFPELQLRSREYWLKFSTVDLRLIHHIAGLSIDMHQRGYSGCTVWAQKMPIFLSISWSHDFVMSAILALSASHLSWKTKDIETEHLAYHHRGVALKGLHEAIGSFSQDNSEAILAASMLLSWQATEWRSWASLQQGVSTVMNAMRPWMTESKLANYLESQRALTKSGTPGTPTFSSSQFQPRPEDLTRLERVNAALHELHGRLGSNEELSELVLQLLTFLQNLRRDFPLQAPEQVFGRLQELRSWLFWLPPAIFRPHEPDVGAFAVLSHFYAVALALDPLFPDIEGAYIGSMSVPAVEDMHRILAGRRLSQPQEAGVQVALALMEVPTQIALEYKSRRQYFAQQSEAYRSSPRSGFTLPPVPLASTPELPSAGLFNNSPVHSSGSLGVPGSYFPPPLHNRSMSQYSNRSPGIRPQNVGERSLSAQSPLGPATLPYSEGFKGEEEMTPGVGYRETTLFHSYGGASGFVAPAQLWT